MGNSNPESLILREFPLVLAKMYEAVGLETDPQLKVRKLVEFFEETVRFLSLVGLGLYDDYGIKDLKVRENRKELDRPTLGQWFDLMSSLDACLREKNDPLIAPTLTKNFHDGPIYDAYHSMMNIMGLPTAKRLKINPFLKTLVEFRNAKIGHGSLTPVEAKQVVSPLHAALRKWILGIPVVKAYSLIYINNVKYQDPGFVYEGTNMNAGTSMFAASIHGEKRIPPKHVYLLKGDEFVSLYPYLWFDNDTKLLYLYTGISKKQNPSLKCPYDISSIQPSIEL
ncbi:MAG: hypothetical protein ACXAB4_01935, partial [Candidatus Hodarchaeales archaeon]